MPFKINTAALTPQPEADDSSVAGDLLRLLASGAVRVVAPIVGGIAGAGLGAFTSPVTGPVGPIAGGIAGAGLAGAGGEAIVEKYLEPHTLNPKHEVSGARVALAGGLSAIPGVALIKAGRPAASAALGAGLSAASTVANKAVVEHQPFLDAINPTKWHWQDWAGLGLGGGTGAVFGAIQKGAQGGQVEGPQLPAPRTEKEILNYINELDKHQPVGPVQPGVIEKQFVIDKETRENPHGPAAQRIWGKSGRPDVIPGQGVVEPPVRAVGALQNYAEEMKNKNESAGQRVQEKAWTQEARNEKERDKFIANEQKQDSRNLNARDKYVKGEQVQDARNLNTTQRYILKEQTQDTRNANARQKFIEGQGVQDTRNENARNKFTVKELLQDTKNEKAVAKYQDAQVGEADALHQAGTLAGLKDTLTQTNEPTVIRETVKGPGEHGGTESATFSRTAPPPPPKESGVAPAPEAPLPDFDPSTPYWSRGDALDEVRKRGFSRADWDVQGSNKTGHYIVRKGDQLPFQSNAVGQSLENSRPWNQLSPEEQTGLIPHIKKAIEGGFNGDVEALGDELAGRLGALKEGRQMANDAGRGADPLIAAIRKAGGFSLNDPMFKGELNWLREHFTKPGQYEGSGGTSRSGAGLFSRKGGSSPDSILEYLKQSNQFPGINSINDLIEHFRSASYMKPQGSVTDELAAGLGNKWWEKGQPASGVEPVVSDYTGGQPEHTIEVPPPATPVAKPTPKATKSARFDESNKGADELEALFNAAHGDELPTNLNPEGNGVLPVEPQVNSAGETEPTLPGVAPQVNQTPKVAEAPFGLASEAPKTAAPVEPELPLAGEQPDLMTRFREAGNNYDAIVKAKKAGQPVAEADRAAAAQLAQKLHKEVIASDPTSDDIANLPPNLQTPLLKELYKRYKASLAKKGVFLGGDPSNNEGGSTVSMFGAGQGANIKGALKGVGLQEAGLKAKNRIMEVARLLPDVQRFNLLANLNNLPINVFVGPWGSTMFAAIERAVAGDPRGLVLIKSLLNPTKFGFRTIKGALGEAKLKIRDASERTEGMGQQGPEWFRKIASIPGEWMTAGDITARNLATEAGFSPEEARVMTMTNDPQPTWGKSIANFKKTKLDDGTVGLDKIARDLSVPFYRTNVNQLQGSMERTPGLGFIAQGFKSAADRPGMRQQITQQALGGGYDYVAYKLGQQFADMDDRSPQSKFVRKFLNDLGGQYGTGVTVAFMAGQASARGKSVPGAITRRLVSGDIPLPTPQPIQDIGSFIQSLMGEKDFKLPNSGIIPTFANPNQPQWLRDVVIDQFKDKSARPVPPGPPRGYHINMPPPPARR